MCPSSEIKKLHFGFLMWRQGHGFMALPHLPGNTAFKCCIYDYCIYSPFHYTCFIHLSVFFVLNISNRLLNAGSTRYGTCALLGDCK